jgi:uncharacterized membrane protein HdeD (DUF308 family)
MVISLGVCLTCVGVTRLIDAVFGEGASGLMFAWAIGIIVGTAFIWQQGQTLLAILSLITGGTNSERF